MLRIVSSDEATVRLLDDIECRQAVAREPRLHESGAVPVPKQMALMGFEVLEAAEVSAAAGKENSSATKAMAKFGVDFHRPEEEGKERGARRNRSYTGMAMDATQMLRPKRHSQSIAGPKQMDVMGFEAREAFEVAAMIATAEAGARALSLSFPGNANEEGVGDERLGGDADRERQLLRRRSPGVDAVLRKRTSNAKVMETLGVAYTEGERSQKLAQAAKSSRRRNSEKSSRSKTIRGRANSASTAEDMSRVHRDIRAFDSILRRHSFESMLRRHSSWLWARSPPAPLEYERVQATAAKPTNFPADADVPLPIVTERMRRSGGDGLSIPGSCSPAYDSGRRTSNDRSLPPGPSQSRRPSWNELLHPDGFELTEMVTALAEESFPSRSTNTTPPHLLSVISSVDHRGGLPLEGILPTHGLATASDSTSSVSSVSSGSSRPSSIASCRLSRNGSVDPDTCMPTDPRVAVA